MGIASGYKHKPAHLSLPWTMLRTASIGLGIGLPANAISTLTGYYYISNMFAIRNSDEALARFAGTIALILEVWPESHWPGFALRQADVFQAYPA